MDNKIALEALSQEMESLRYSLAEMIMKTKDVDPERREEMQARIRRLKREVELTAKDLGIARHITITIKSKDGDVEDHDVVFPLYGRYQKHGECDCFWKIEDGSKGLSMLNILVYFALDIDSNEVVLWCEEFRSHVNFMDGSGSDFWLGRGEHRLEPEQFERLLEIAMKKFDGTKLVVG